MVVPVRLNVGEIRTQGRASSAPEGQPTVEAQAQLVGTLTRCPTHGRVRAIELFMEEIAKDTEIKGNPRKLSATSLACKCRTLDTGGSAIFVGACGRYYFVARRTRRSFARAWHAGDEHGARSVQTDSALSVPPPRPSPPPSLPPLPVLWRFSRDQSCSRRPTCYGL